MEALGLILLIALLFIYTPTILNHIFFYVLERSYDKICEEKKKETNK